MDLNHILNWELKKGSHEFPGPAGGTCINEAAIVAMGFEYRSVNSPTDCPPCFSRPISAFAIKLNDAMPDDLRNELLMPFVTRLGGTADTPEVEWKRFEYMVVQIARRLAAPQLQGLGEPEQAARWAACETIDDVRRCASSLDLARALDLDLARALARALALDLDLDLARALDLDLDLDLARARARALDLDLDLARAERKARARTFFTTGVEILEEAIRLGKQGDAIEAETVKARMDKVRELIEAS